MLEAVDPFSFVTSSIRPYELAVSILLIICILSYVFSSVGPGERSLAVHFIASPVALKFPIVIPSVHALTVDVIVLEFTDVHGAVGPLEGTYSMFLTILIVTLILGCVGPCLNTKAVLLVLDPVTGVLGPIHVLVGTSSVGLVVEPIAVEAVPIRVDQPPISVRLVIFPEAFVFAAVLPDLCTFALTVAILGPLSEIDGAIVELMWSLCNEIWILIHITHFRIINNGPKTLLRLSRELIRVVRHEPNLLTEESVCRLALISKVLTTTLHFLFAPSGKLWLGIYLLFLCIHVFTDDIASISSLNLANEFVMRLKSLQ